MELHVTAQRWTPELLDEVCDVATGVILGDLFCQKRMFAHEWFDLPDLARQAKNRGVRVVFQTPTYNTPRTLELTLSAIRKLADADLLDAVLVHDIGVLTQLRELPVECWWDRFAFNRDFVPNAYLVDFLREQGVSRVEVLRPIHINAVADAGGAVLLYGYGPEIASFGRICYTEYFLNEPCEQKILCHRHNPVITSVDKVPLQYAADGYLLIDQTDPMHIVSDLAPELAGRVAGLTASIRSAAELSLLTELRAALSAEPMRME